MDKYSDLDKIVQALFHIEKKDRIIRSIRKLLDQIFSHMGSITFLDWWRLTRNYNLEDHKILQTFFVSSYNLESMTIQDFDKELREFLSLSNNPDTATEEMLKISKEIDNDVIVRLLQGKKIRKVSIETKLSVERLAICIVLKKMIQFVEQIHTLNQYSINDRILKLDMLTENFEEISDYAGLPGKNSSDLKTQIINLKYLNKERQNNLNYSTENNYLSIGLAAYNSSLDSAINIYQTCRDNLFILLNISISKHLKDELIQIIKKSSLRLVLQHDYNRFRTQYPWAQNIRFFGGEVYVANYILPLNFNEGKPSNESMRLHLKHKELTALYLKLMEERWIDKTTDILDFAFALTGSPASRSILFNRINWIKGNKQTLAIFLGLLREKKTSSSWYWNISSELFFFKGNRFTPKQLSSPYGRFFNHPETRGKDWYHITNLLSGIIKVN